MEKLLSLRAERQRREARRETFTTPKLVTTQQSILGPPAEGQPGPSIQEMNMKKNVVLLSKEKEANVQLQSPY